MEEGRQRERKGAEKREAGGDADGRNGRGEGQTERKGGRKTMRGYLSTASSFYWSWLWPPNHGKPVVHGTCIVADRSAVRLSNGRCVTTWYRRRDASPPHTTASSTLSETGNGKRVPRSWSCRGARTCCCWNWSHSDLCSSTTATYGTAANAFTMVDIPCR